MIKKIKHVLISVSDKSHLENLASFLKDLKATLYATSGTAHSLRSWGLEIRDAQELAQAPEILDGRVKTLSSHLFASILADTRNPEHQNELQQRQIPALDLVVANLYPFINKSEETDFTNGLENWIDIGGVSLIRAAAKNFHNVSVLSSPDQYQDFINHYKKNNGVDLSYRQILAAQAFTQTSRYDRAIAEKWSQTIGHHEKQNPGPMSALCYGENPQQRAQLHTDSTGLPWSCLRGENFSFNTYADSMAALEALSDLQQVSGEFYGQLPACVIIKHQAPCGMALGRNPLEAMARARDCDSVSSFGGILAINFPLNAESAMWAKQFFWEVIIAPDFSAESLDILAQKKGKLRLLKANLAHPSIRGTKGKILGGDFWITQNYDHFQKEAWQLKTGVWESADQALFHFAACLVKNLKSNAVCLVAFDHDGLPTWMGAGQGQPNRLQAFSHLALAQAKARADYRAEKIMLVSEAFMPFSDLIELAAKENIRKVVAPGGSVRDEEVIARAQELQVSLAFGQYRHFKH